MKHAAPVFILTTLLSLAAFPALQAQRAAPPATIVLASSAAEYPPLELQLQSSEQTGLSAKLAAVRVAQAPDDPETVAALLGLQRVDQAVALARQIVDTHPERISRLFRLLEPSGVWLRDAAAAKWTERASDVIAAARGHLAGLPRADRAEAAYRLLLAEMTLDRNRGADRAGRLEAFVQEFAGTDAAFNAEIDLLGEGRWTAERAAAFDAFVGLHPGTCAAGRALYGKGWGIAHASSKPKDDPTDRFMQVIEIVTQLESGAYRDCEWEAKARDLVTGFYAYQPSYAEGNIDRMLDAGRAFVRTHFAIDGADPAGYGVGYMATGGIVGVLHTLKGDGVAGVERDLEALEQHVAEPFAVRYLHAQFLINRLRQVGAGAELTASLQKAAALLADIHAHGSGLYQRKALATLASLHLYLGDYPNARAAYASYVERYPASPYAWVAALRTGLCDERAGDWAAALASYRRAVQSYAAIPPARFMGNAYAARAHEALGDFEQARIGYQRALDGWDNDYGSKFSMRALEAAARRVDFEISFDSTEVSKEALVARLAELTRTAAAPGGTAIERGRWLIQRGQWADATAVLDQAVTQFPKSANLAEARSLGHTSRLETALDRANPEKPGTDEAAALTLLESLAKEPADFAVSAAKITRACLLAGRGKAQDARRLMIEALEDLRTRQRVEIERAALTGIEQDVAAIREAIVKPTGDPMYGSGGWNAFSWPTTLPMYVLVNARVPVKFSDGFETPVIVRQRFAQMDHALVVDADQFAFLSKLVRSIGGTKTRTPAAVMETPNQPVGRSVDVGRFLNEFFPVRPGHWGGWEFLTYPVVSRIEFVNEERTKARASVTIGYSGADVVMEKVNGAWKAIGLVNQWIT
jgi:tetratricopeptide (TPR) repeat protein